MQYIAARQCSQWFQPIMPCHCSPDFYNGKKAKPKKSEKNESVFIYKNLSFICKKKYSKHVVCGGSPGSCNSGSGLTLKQLYTPGNIKKRKFNNAYVALWDPESTQFQCYLGPSPRDGRTLVHFNVVLTFFHIYPIYQGVCKTVSTTFWCNIVLQSQGEGHEKAHTYGTDSGQIFRTFSPQLENNNTLKCSSYSFAHTLRYVVNV